VVNVGSFRTSGGGWLKLAFKNVAGSGIASVDLAAVGGPQAPAAAFKNNACATAPPGPRLCAPVALSRGHDT
jgi:hypothetical protein